MVQNTNGISIGKDGDLVITLDHVKQMEADVMIITEANLDTNNTKVKAIIHNDLRTTFGLATYPSQLTTSTSPRQYNGYYKPGGVTRLVIEKTKGRLLESGGDYMGRWIY
jgi:hypothetical protein